jgi:Protein of unknown function (DUF4230)
MENNKGWVLVIGVLVIIAIVSSAMIWLVYDSFQRTVTPVQSMTGELATQVSSMLNPTPTLIPNPITIIRDVRSLARLETIQYTVEKVITAEQGQGTLGALFGDKLIFVAHGQVIAGIDLSKLGAGDIEIKEGILYMQLPKPEIFVAALDNEKSYVYDRQTGLLTKGDINLESSARRLAEDEIEKAAVEDGIMDLARQNAENYLTRLLSDLGYPEVIFVNNNSTPQT